LREGDLITMGAENLGPGVNIQKDTAILGKRHKGYPHAIGASLFAKIKNRIKWRIKNHSLETYMPWLDPDLMSAAKRLRFEATEKGRVHFEHLLKTSTHSGVLKQFMRPSSLRVSMSAEYKRWESLWALRTETEFLKSWRLGKEYSASHQKLMEGMEAWAKSQE
jgi:hypothetical protein